MCVNNLLNDFSQVWHEKDMSQSSQNDKLHAAVQDESRKFKECYLWLEKSMSPAFFKEITHDKVMLVTHNLMEFDLQGFFCTINLKRAAICMCLDSADADLRILENYANYGIRNYQAYLSNSPPPFKGVTAFLRVAVIYFTEMEETPYPFESKEELKQLIQKRNPELKDEEFYQLIGGINSRFLRSLSLERLILALDMFFRAKTRDNCQYEIRYEEDWKEGNKPSLQIVLAWRNTPKYNFLYRVALTIHRHGLVMKRVHATYVNPYSKDSILIMSLGLHGAKNEAAWEAANIPNFLRELVTIKYFASDDSIDKKLVAKGLVTGVMGNLLRAMLTFIHQALVHSDPYLYTLENIEEALTRHPELTQKLVEAFQLKFDPAVINYQEYLQARDWFLTEVSKLDTGNEEIDTRRKNVLFQGMNMIHHILKTNLYQQNYTALSFRLDPKYLDEIPFERAKKFPELPFAIFFIQGMHYFGFHIRFRDLARGGLRTVVTEQQERMLVERNQVFTECYNLAYTQQMKNKDIPEGGAKGIIFLKPDDQLASEIEILKRELPGEDTKLEGFREEQKVEYLYQAQRSFVESLLTLVNCEPDGKIRAKNIIDYWKKPEYLYLGPDENMHDEMIRWIANISKKYNYKPGSAFISSKPIAGINHKEYGVTSLGLNVYMQELLKYAGIDPTVQPFTIKMSGGPDGDVAGNQIVNLFRLYPNTAKLLALIDVSGVIFDPQGLDLKYLTALFYEKKPIRFYPPEKLSEGGFLLDKETKRQPSALALQTLCYRKKEGKIVHDWMHGSEMNAILRTFIHQTKADIFIPGGGRPRTLNEDNLHDFLDETGKPTSRLIVEGANLYITPGARRKLEELNVLIIKDSSANKTGVICSSFEVLSNLAIGDLLFIQHKEPLVQEILVRLKELALLEAHLLLKTHAETKAPLTEISNKISQRINQFSDQLMYYLDKISLNSDPDDPLMRTFLAYCLPSLREQYRDLCIENIPDQHKKACIACHLSASLVYKKGLSWFPSIVDILPLALDQLEC